MASQRPRLVRLGEAPPERSAGPEPLAGWDATAGRTLRASASRAARFAARNRLLHFLVAGACIFALAPRPASRTDIAFEHATFDALIRAQADRLDTPQLDDGTAHEVRARAIEDEVLYREAIRLGFDRDDNVVRQRLIQKVLFLAEDLAGIARPVTDDELRAFFESTRGQWTRPERVRLIYVFVGATRRDLLQGLREQLPSSTDEPPALGDPSPLPRTVDASREELVRDYGQEFAAAVATLPVGAWSEPVRSKHGWHLVQVLEREEPRASTFEEARARLPLAYLVARKKQATAAYLQRAFARYRITIDGEPLDASPITERIAEPRQKRPD